jgi:hypothetical protein
MNGEMLLVANQFLVRLNKVGFVSSDIRVRSIAHTGNYTTRTNFANYAQFSTTFAPVLNSITPTDYIGDYPFVESINITYPRLGYSNLFRCYDILNNRKIVQTVGVTKNSQSNNSEIERTQSDISKLRDIERALANLNNEFDKYKISANSTYATIIQYYVDRNYVIDGYVDTKSDTLTK